MLNSGSFHFNEPLFHLFLSHPHFITLRMIVSINLFPCFSFNICLFGDISLMSNFVGFIKLCFHQPFFHLIHLSIMHCLLTFHMYKKFLSNLPFRFIYKFLFQTFLCILFSNPLSERRSTFVSKCTLYRAYTIIWIQKRTLWACTYSSLFFKSSEQNLRSIGIFIRTGN